MKTYKINEIFYSLQGEGYYTGTPAIFIRFSGCNLHCPYCDTDHSEGRFLTGPEIFEEVEKYPSQYVVLTQPRKDGRHRDQRNTSASRQH